MTSQIQSTPQERLMNPFPDELIFKTLPNRKRQLVKPFRYVTPTETITVPAGFKTDLASVPRIFWTLLPPTGRYEKAAVIHDWLYFIQDRTRKEVDRIFLEGMKALGVPWWKRRIMYSAVRLGGGAAWKENAEKNIAAALEPKGV